MFQQSSINSGRELKIRATQLAQRRGARHMFELVIVNYSKRHLRDVDSSACTETVDPSRRDEEYIYLPSPTSIY